MLLPSQLTYSFGALILEVGIDYGSVRIGTFMGRRIIKFAAGEISSFAEHANGSSQTGGASTDEYEDDTELLKQEASLGYLCNISPHRYEALYAKHIPISMKGEAFLSKYTSHDDTVTTIDPKRTYEVKAPTKHPIYENFRVKTLRALLTAASTNDQLCALGELMYQCHYSYSECGLGSDGTGRLVNLVQEMQHRRSSKDNSGTLFGAKITGGGSGGSVCVMGRNSIRSSEQILEIQQRYKAATGYLPCISEGSSPGAGKFGYLRLLRRRHPKSESH